MEYGTDMLENQAIFKERLKLVDMRIQNEGSCETELLSYWLIAF